MLYGVATGQARGGVVESKTLDILKCGSMLIFLHRNDHLLVTPLGVAPAHVGCNLIPIKMTAEVEGLMVKASSLGRTLSSLYLRYASIIRLILTSVSKPIKITIEEYK